MHKKVLFVCCLISCFFSSPVMSDEVSTPGRLNDIEITGKIFSKLFTNIHYRLKGFCVWGSWWDGFDVTPAVEHMMPDLVVSVYNRPRSNPWKEIQEVVESSSFVKSYEKAYQVVTGSKVSYGASETTTTSSSHLRRYLVDVIGSPNVFLNSPISLPYIIHRSDTILHVPYYLAMTDLVPSRMLASELLYTATRIPKGSITGMMIGEDENPKEYKVWGYQMPRHMAVYNSNPFRAAVVSAMHAVDIVTNVNTGHVVHSTSNSCGRNCVVSNATFDGVKKGDIIWQEIFPKNRNITPGSSDEGIDDNIKGNGNYLFVVWRKYRGCIQGSGKLVYKSYNAGSPVKR